MSEAKTECTISLSQGGSDHMVTGIPCGINEEYSAPVMDKLNFLLMDNLMRTGKDPVFEVKFSNSSDCSILELMQGKIVKQSFGTVEFSDTGFYLTTEMASLAHHVGSEVEEMKESYSATQLSLHTWLEMLDTVGFVSVIAHRIPKLARLAVDEIRSTINKLKMEGDNKSELKAEANRFSPGFIKSFMICSDILEQMMCMNIASQIHHHSFEREFEELGWHWIDELGVSKARKLFLDAKTSFKMWNQKNVNRGRDLKDLGVVVNSIQNIRYQVSSIYAATKSKGKKYVEALPPFPENLFSPFVLPCSHGTPVSELYLTKSNSSRATLMTPWEIFEPNRIDNDDNAIFDDTGDNNN